MAFNKTPSEERHRIENALKIFTADAVNARKKIQNAKRNMECRRKLEMRWDDMQLRRETSKFEFDFERNIPTQERGNESAKLQERGNEKYEMPTLVPMLLRGNA